MSLSDYKISAVLPVSDLVEARRFYEGKLELRVATEDDHSVTYDAGGGTQLLVYVSPSGAGSSTATAATWEVDDLDDEMRWLRGAGVEFEDYYFDDFQTVNGVATDETGRAAWFLDPDGNTLCLHETV